MKKSLLILLPLLIASSLMVQAGPCGIGTLATYGAMGFSCTIDGLTFSDFSYSTTASGGASTPDATGVGVIPQTGGGEIGFLFQGGWVATPKQTEDSLISYTVTCASGTNCINDLFLQMVGGASSPGAASVAETASNGAGLFTFAGGGTPIFTDSTMFKPVETLSLEKDIVVSGGTGDSGAAHISAAFNLFSTTSSVPEPALAAFCAGMLLLIPVARRRFGRKASGM
jgi:hypothetical protein